MIFLIARCILECVFCNLESELEVERIAIYVAN